MDKKRLKYLKEALKHLKNCKMAFCYGETGEFLAIGTIKKEIAELEK